MFLFFSWLELGRCLLPLHILSLLNALHTLTRTLLLAVPCLPLPAIGLCLSTWPGYTNLTGNRHKLCLLIIWLGRAIGVLILPVMMLVLPAVLVAVSAVVLSLVCTLAIGLVRAVAVRLVAIGITPVWLLDVGIATVRLFAVGIATVRLVAVGVSALGIVAVVWAVAGA
jgi:hypothetical protein